MGGAGGGGIIFWSSAPRELGGSGGGDEQASERGHWATMKPLGTRRVVKARGRALAAKRPAQGPGGASDGQRMGDGEEALRCRLSTFMGKAEESPTGKGRVTAETAASFR
ncbi:unnamed protein product [Lampetra planeri]